MAKKADKKVKAKVAPLEEGVAPEKEAVAEGELEEKIWVMVTPSFDLGIAGKKYLAGQSYNVPIEIGQTILHMSELKRNAELSIFVGKKYEIKRLLTPTGYRVIRKEVGSVA